MEEDVRSVLRQIRSLSEDGGGRGVPEESPDPSEYPSSLNGFDAVIQTLLTQRFLEELPRTAVCILSGRQDCGPEAELTKAVSLDLIKPLLAFVSTVRTQTCAPGPGDAGSARASLRMGQSSSGALTSVQESIFSTLSSLPPSGTLLGTMGSLIDATLTYVLNLVGTLLQAPVDYVKLALQFGIRTPSLDGKETCNQGKKK